MSFSQQCESPQQAAVVSGVDPRCCGGRLGGEPLVECLLAFLLQLFL